MAERKSSTITWKIKNFSFCWQKDETELTGPTFAIEGLQGSKWTLFLFPRASRSKLEGSIALYLYHENEETESQEVEIDCELSALGCDGQPLETVLFTKSIMQGNDWSSPLLLRKKTVFLEKRHEFLPNDTLTVRCRIWRANQENKNPERYIATTRIEVDELSLFGVLKITCAWKLNGKRYYVKFISSSVTPPIFMMIKVSEDGQSYAEIKQAKEGVLKFCKCKLKFINDSEKKIAFGQDEFLFPNYIPLYCDSVVWSLPLTFTEQSCTSSSFARNKIMCPEMDNLNLRCEILYSTGIVTEDINRVDYSITTFQNGCCLKEKRQEQLPGLKDDLFSLMRNADNCDIKLATVNRVFPAHRIILKARSLYFRNKLDSENYRQTIYLLGLDSETLYHMLVFLYTDNIENLESKNVMKLYIASERYGIPSLKYKCSCLLQNNLDSSICCDALQAADQYQDSDLKKAALNYIIEHDDEVIGSDKWQDLKIFTELTDEVLHLIRINN